MRRKGRGIHSSSTRQGRSGPSALASAMRRPADTQLAPSAERIARKLAIDGSAAAPLLNLQSLLGADALNMPTLVSTRCSACPSCHVYCGGPWRCGEPGIGERVSMTTYRSPSPRQGRNMHPRECPYERLAVAPAGDIWEYTGLVIHDTRGRRASPSLLRARQRLLRCRQMTNSPPWVQASGGLLVSGEHRPA
jgi:hypothetical protein